MLRLLYVRMLASRSIENVMTRVRSACSASAIKSNISAKCASRSFGTPIGASGMSSALVSAVAAICTRRSLPRPEPRYPPTAPRRGSELPAARGAILAAELVLQARGLPHDAIENAPSLLEDRGALGL